MVKIPDYTALGTRLPQAISSTPSFPSRDASADALGNLGKTLSEVGNFWLQKQDQDNNAVEVPTAQAMWDDYRRKTAASFNYDGQYDTYGERSAKQLQAGLYNASLKISNPKKRAEWVAHAANGLSETQNAITNRGAELQHQDKRVQLNSNVETFYNIAIDPKTSEEDRKVAMANMNATLEAGQSAGVLTPAERESITSNAVKKAPYERARLELARDGYAFGKATPRSDVAKLIAKAADTYGVPQEVAIGLAHIESGLNPNAKNPDSSAGGLFQITKKTAIAWGVGNVFDAVTSADATMRETKKFMDNFQSAHGRPATPGEIYLNHFLGGGTFAKVGNASDDTVINSIDQAAVNSNKFMDGWTVGQLRTWADKKMREGAIKGGAGGGPMTLDNAPDYVRDLPADQQQALVDYAETQQKQEMVDLRGGIEVATTNAPVAVQNTGGYEGHIPTLAEFQAAYGNEEGALRADAFQASMDVAGKVHGFQTASAEEIAGIVAAAEPTSSGTDAALEQKKYDALSTAAAATFKARADDPAGYTMRAFPNVQQAWSDATSAENKDFQPAMAAMSAAQTQLGIPIEDQVLIPKEIAADAVDSFKDETLDPGGRLGPAQQLMASTSDPAQRKQIFDQLVKAGIPDITAGAFAAMERGDPGAAQRLFQAALTDVSKLPGKSPNTQDEIAGSIQTNLMDAGQVGDIVYGISGGEAGDTQEAERDSKLLSNAIALRVRKGEDLEAATIAAGKDLFGDVKAVTDYGVKIVVPTKADEQVYIDALETLRPKVEAAVKAGHLVPTGAPQGEFAGLSEKGNIDLQNRPRVTNADGSISTVRSVSFNIDGKEVLIPTVSPDGKIMSNEDAIRLYKSTGQHLGKFDTPEHATAYAEALHNAQEEYYATRDATGFDTANSMVEVNTARIMSDGYFYSSNGGYVFIDAKTGQPVMQSGKPMFFSEEEVGKIAGRQQKDAAAAEEKAMAPLPEDRSALSILAQRTTDAIFGPLPGRPTP